MSVSLKDLDMVWWKNTKTWTTKEGKIMKIKDMESSHIYNCMKLVERKIKNFPVFFEDLHNGKHESPIYKAFQKELRKRFGDWYDILYKE